MRLPFLMLPIYAHSFKLARLVLCVSKHFDELTEPPIQVADSASWPMLAARRAAAAALSGA